MTKVGYRIQPGLEVIKLFSCSTQLSIKFVLLINLKLLIIANSFSLDIAEHEIFSKFLFLLLINMKMPKIFSANKYENAKYFLC